MVVDYAADVSEEHSACIIWFEGVNVGTGKVFRSQIKSSERIRLMYFNKLIALKAVIASRLKTLLPPHPQINLSLLVRMRKERLK